MLVKGPQDAVVAGLVRAKERLRPCGEEEGVRAAEVAPYVAAGRGYVFKEPGSVLFCVCEPDAEELKVGLDKCAPTIVGPVYAEDPSTHG